MWSSRAEVPLADRDAEARGVLRDPLAHARDDLHRLADPGLVHVGRIPQARVERSAERRRSRDRSRRPSPSRSRRSPGRSGRRRRRGASPGPLLVLAELPQVPGEQRHVAVRAAVGPAAEARPRPRPRRGTGPAPLGRSGDGRVRVGAPDGAAVRDRPLEQLVVGERLGVDVAVRRVPEHRLVVEDVLGDAALADGAVACRISSHPALDLGGRVAHARPRRIRGERAPVGRSPSPASGRSGAVARCAPSRDTGNAYDVVSLATHPSIGIVSAVARPCARFSSRNVSWVYGPRRLTSTFRKNQSLLVFQAAQLPVVAAARVAAPAPRRRAELPPRRRRVTCARDAIDEGADGPRGDAAVHRRARRAAAVHPAGPPSPRRRRASRPPRARRARRSRGAAGAAGRSRERPGRGGDVAADRERHPGEHGVLWPERPQVAEALHRDDHRARRDPERGGALLGDRARG